jgi:uncharacterized SAM-binding protein YcdF (DUF218 family)
MDITWLKAVAKALVLPPGGLLLLALLGVSLQRRHPRTGATLSWFSLLALIALCMPGVSFELQKAQGSLRPLDVQEARKAQAIVILGGGSRLDAEEYGGDTASSATLERLRYGARLARETKLPVMVSGGVVFRGEPEARIMREILEREYGVPVRWMEDGSRNTHENAQRSAPILRSAGIARVVLVSHQVSMARAQAEFAAAGIATLAAPTVLPSEEADPILRWLPQPAALLASYQALHEMLGERVRQWSTPAEPAHAAPARVEAKS